MSALLEKQAIRQPGPCPVIETGRLVLRPHRMSDAPAIAESLGDFQVSRMLARVPVPYDRKDATDWLSRANSSLTPDWAFAITEGDDAHIGVVALELRNGLWHLGYWLNRYFWGRGIMSEAASAAIERFYRRMPETSLHSGAFADNAASLSIQKRLGFSITRCGDLYSSSRNAMAPHIETVLTQPAFRSLERHEA
ncbi:MAG: GNAT family N-acetyltransferase [Allorhizobium sp.]